MPEGVLFSRLLEGLIGGPPLYLRTLREQCTAKNYHHDSPLSVISKVFEKHVINRIVDDLEKCGLFSDFQYGFRSS